MKRASYARSHGRFARDGQNDPNFGPYRLLEEARKSWDYRVLDEIVHLMKTAGANGKLAFRIAERYLKSSLGVLVDVSLNIEVNFHFQGSNTAPPPPTQRVRVGGNVQAANLLTQVKPVYPPQAKQAGIQGVVVLEAEISKEGTVDSVRVITGHPLLSQAAIDAVKRWRYKPTLLNGESVPVVTTITVNFPFSQ